jgi:hypothetical protein
MELKLQVRILSWGLSNFVTVIEVRILFIFWIEESTPWMDNIGADIITKFELEG